jgi:hypothetical protein
MGICLSIHPVFGIYLEKPKSYFASFFESNLGNTLGFFGGSETNFIPPRSCCFFRSSAIACRLKLKRVACSSRTLRTSWTIGSSHILHLHQLQWSAYHWRFITIQTTDKFNIGSDSSIGNVLEIPCNQIIHAIDGCNSDMQCIFYSFCIDCALFDQPFSQYNSIRSYIK